MLTCPAAKFTIDPGIKKGEILRGPPFNIFECSRSITSKPPMPEPICTPTRSATVPTDFSPECSIASCEAASAKWMKRPIFRDSFFSTNSSGSKCLTSAAKRTGCPVRSKCVISAMPLLPANSPCQTSGVVLPTPHNSPMPVTTTRRCSICYLPAFCVFSM